MLQILSTWLACTAFVGAGVFNAVGTATLRASFVRWGYPAWWCRVTGVLELAIAALIAVPATRTVGVILGAVVIAAAGLAVIRHREFSHLAPIGVFTVLLFGASGGF